LVEACSGVVARGTVIADAPPRAAAAAAAAAAAPSRVALQCLLRLGSTVAVEPFVPLPVAADAVVELLVPALLLWAPLAAAAADPPALAWLLAGAATALLAAALVADAAAPFDVGAALPLLLLDGAWCWPPPVRAEVAAPAGPPDLWGAAALLLLPPGDGLVELMVALPPAGRSDEGAPGLCALMVALPPPKGRSLADPGGVEPVAAAGPPTLAEVPVNPLRKPF